MLLLRRKWLLIISTTVIGIGSILYALSKPDIYESRCVLLLEDPSALTQLIDGKHASVSEGGPSAISVIQVVRQRLLSWQSVIQHIRFLELDKDLEKDDFAGLRDLYTEISEKVNLSAKGGNLINISYRGENPEMNLRMLDGLMTKFFETSLKKSTDVVNDRMISFEENKNEVAENRTEEITRVLKPKIDNLNKQLNELAKETSLVASVNPFRIVEPVRISYESLKSVKIKIVGLGVIIGLGLGIGLIFGLDKIDHRFKTVEEVQNYLDIPYLGKIPTILTCKNEKKV